MCLVWSRAEFVFVSTVVRALLVSVILRNENKRSYIYLASVRGPRRPRSIPGAGHRGDVNKSGRTAHGAPEAPGLAEPGPRRGVECAAAPSLSD